MDKDCLFCKIVAGEIKSKLVYESDKVLAFPDVNPIADIHILIIPKRHIDSVLSVSAADAGELVDMFGAARKIVEDMKIEGFKIVFNGGRRQHVPHMHMHLLAGKKK